MGAAALVPEVKQAATLTKAFVHYLCFAAGLGLLLILQLAWPGDHAR